MRRNFQQDRPLGEKQANKHSTKSNVLLQAYQGAYRKVII
jgi:hypothetical protein